MKQVEIMTDYADLVRKIDILKAQIELTEVDMLYWWGEDAALPLFSKGAAKFGLDIAAKRVDTVRDRQTNLIKRLEFYEEIEKEIRTNIDAMTGLRYVIARKRFIEGQTYKEIAVELGYSYDHIRRIASKCHNHATAIPEKV